MIERWMEEGMQAARAGNRPLAVQLFSNVVNADPNHYEGWLWLSDVVDDPAKKLEILNWLLQVDPANRRARSRLNALHQQMAGGPPPARTAPQFPPAGGLPSGSTAQQYPVGGSGTFRPAAQSGMQAVQPPQQSGASKEKWALIAAVALLAVCLVGAGGVYLGSQFFARPAGESAAALPEATEAPAVPASDPVETPPPPAPTDTPVLPTPTPEPTATIPPPPTATPAPLPDFRDDFEHGIADQWFGDLNALKITNGRLGFKEHFSKVFVGDPGWNNYSLSFDVCVDDEYSDYDWAFFTFLFHVKPRDSKIFTANGFNIAGREDDLRVYPDILTVMDYTERSSGGGTLDRAEVDFRFWENRCAQVNLQVRDKNAELFWNGRSVYTLGSVVPLDGAVGFDLEYYMTIDNVVVQPLP